MQALALTGAAAAGAVAAWLSISLLGRARRPRGASRSSKKRSRAAGNAVGNGLVLVIPAWDCPVVCVSDGEQALQIRPEMLGELQSQMADLHLALATTETLIEQTPPTSRRRSNPASKPEERNAADLQLGRLQELRLPDGPSFSIPVFLPAPVQKAGSHICLQPGNHWSEPAYGLQEKLNRPKPGPWSKFEGAWPTGCGHAQRPGLVKGRRARRAATRRPAASVPADCAGWMGLTVGEAAAGAQLAAEGPAPGPETPSREGSQNESSGASSRGAESVLTPDAGKDNGLVVEAEPIREADDENGVHTNCCQTGQHGAAANNGRECVLVRVNPAQLACAAAARRAEPADIADQELVRPTADEPADGCQPGCAVHDAHARPTQAAATHAATDRGNIPPGAGAQAKEPVASSDQACLAARADERLAEACSPGRSLNAGLVAGETGSKAVKCLDRARQASLNETLKAADVDGNDQEEDGTLPALVSLLDQLTADNFDELVGEMLRTRVTRLRTLSAFVDHVFKKALSESSVSPLCASLCAELNKAMPKFQHASKPADVRCIVLQKCQELYEVRQGQRERSRQEPADAQAAAAGTIPVADAQSLGCCIVDRNQADEGVERQHALGLMEFMGHLFNVGLLTEKVVHITVQQLLNDDATPQDVERGAKLLLTVGARIAAGKHKPMLDEYVKRLCILSKAECFERCIRSGLLDVIDMSENDWKPRQPRQDDKASRCVQSIPGGRQVHMHRMPETCAQAALGVRQEPSVLVSKESEVTGERDRLGDQEADTVHNQPASSNAQKRVEGYPDFCAVCEVQTPPTCAVPVHKTGKACASPPEAAAEVARPVTSSNEPCRHACFDVQPPAGGPLRVPSPAQRVAGKRVSKGVKGLGKARRAALKAEQLSAKDSAEVEEYECGRQRAFALLLDRLDEEGFEAVVREVLAIEVPQICTLEGFVHQIVYTVLTTDAPCQLYAKLCSRLQRLGPRFTVFLDAGETQGVDTRSIVVTRCQELYEALPRPGSQGQAEASAAKAMGAAASCTTPDSERACNGSAGKWDEVCPAQVARCFEFIGHLCQEALLSEKVVHMCIQSQLADGYTLENIACSLRLLLAAGRKLAAGKNAVLVNKYIARLKDISGRLELPDPMALMLKRVVTMNEGNWKLEDASPMSNVAPGSQETPLCREGTSMPESQVIFTRSAATSGWLAQTHATVYPPCIIWAFTLHQGCVSLKKCRGALPAALISSHTFTLSAGREDAFIAQPHCARNPVCTSAIAVTALQTPPITQLCGVQGAETPDCFVVI